MNAFPLKLILGIVSAVIVPSMLIPWLTPDDRLRLGLSCVPFGWRILMIVHIVASLPIAGITSAALVRSTGLELRPRLSALLIFLGLLGVWAVVIGGESLGNTLEFWEAGFPSRVIVRAILAYLLVMPWMVVASLLGEPHPRISSSWAAFLVGTTLALLPPLVYTHQYIDNRLMELKANLDTGRILKAKAILLGLSDLGFRKQAGETFPSPTVTELEATLARMDREVNRELPASSPPSTRLERAFQLIQLERLDQAEPILRSLSETSAEAIFLLGAVYRDQARWSESEQAYRQGLGLLMSGTIRDRRSQELFLTAYDGLAEAARSGGHPETSEQVYQEARRLMPSRAGYFTFQLGRHYLNGGRSLDALTQLRQAVRLDPTLETQVRPLILQAQVRTPACLLRVYPR